MTRNPPCESVHSLPTCCCSAAHTHSQHFVMILNKELSHKEQRLRGVFSRFRSKRDRIAMALSIGQQAALSLLRFRDSTPIVIGIRAGRIPPQIVTWLRRQRKRQEGQTAGFVTKISQPKFRHNWDGSPRCVFLGVGRSIRAFGIAWLSAVWRLPDWS